MKTTKRKAISKKETINSGAGGQWHAGTTDGIVLFNKKKVSKKEVKLPKDWGKMKYEENIKELDKQYAPIHEAMEKEYLRGYDDGAREQAQVFEDTYQNAQQVKKDISWGKWDIQINWAYVIIAVLLGLIFCKLLVDYNYGFINA